MSRFQKNKTGIPSGLVLLAGFVFILSACQDPYPEDKVFGTKPPPPQEDTDTRKDYVLSLPVVMQLNEGEESTFAIHAMVPSPGVPVITVDGLPKGAQFDGAGSHLRWKPDYRAANDPKNPLIVQRSYPVRVRMSSSTNPKATITKKALFLVFDKRRKFDFKWPSKKITFWEGRLGSLAIEINSIDFPIGPFQVVATGLPPGAIVRETNALPGTIHIDWQPHPETVSVKDQYSWRDSRYYRDVSPQIEVYDPRGNKVSNKTEWRVFDARIAPDISGPTRLKVGSSISFMIKATDPNGEAAPRLTLERQPDFGKVTLRKESPTPGIQASQYPTQTLHVAWEHIPFDKVGQSQEFKFRACVQKKKNVWNQCTTHKLKVKVDFGELIAPVIKRAAWKAGKIEYFRTGQSSQRISLPIRLKGAAQRLSVRILPKEMEKQVIWSAGSLHIYPESEGMNSFTVEASNEFNVKTHETFYFESLPANWEKTLLIGDGVEDSETKANLKLFHSARMVNPLFQKLDPRMLAHRENLIITTFALNQSEAMDALSKITKKVKNIYVFSPALERLPTKLIDEAKAGGLELIGRISSGLKLGQSKLMPYGGSDLKNPQAKVVPQGTLTNQSHAPHILGLDNLGDGRAKLMLQFKSGEMVTVAGAVERKGGGNLLFSGIEFSDLKVQPKDKGLLKLWLETLMK